MINSEDIFNYTKYARRDFGLWFALFVCTVISITIFYLDSSKHCPENTECLPLWLVYTLGVGTVSIVFAILLAFLLNRSQGSYIDLETGKLSWWQYTTRKGNKKSILMSDIKEIYIRDDSDSTEARLYDVNGNMIPMFNSGVIPYPEYKEWTDAIKQKWPHIKIEVK